MKFDWLKFHEDFAIALSLAREDNFKVPPSTKSFYEYVAKKCESIERATQQ